jgi:hypothetical protein
MEAAAGTIIDRLVAFFFSLCKCAEVMLVACTPLPHHDSRALTYTAHNVP